MSHGGPFATGLISALLPCGWLHTFVLGAVATQSPWIGALYLFLFWAGTLPALSLAPLAASRLFQPLAQKAPKISGTFLILLGLATIGIKMDLLKSEHSHCHSAVEAPNQDSDHHHHHDLHQHSN
jgi:sulfite exporter TauE/SafE